MLMQATMFLAQPKRARLHVLQEHSAIRPVRVRVLTLRQDILCHLQVNPAKRHVLQEHSAIRPVRARVQTLLQATMFLAQPKRARLLVLQEPTTRAPVHPVHQPAQMPTLDITFHLPANRARPLVQ